MAKDLRGFLELPRDAAQKKESQSSVPLAHRRGLTSPGEPRVFQVRAGFVCGLCGQIHKRLDRAFDCLGRCTVQLRLRSPAGPSQFGLQAHFACTACGRGFANCDDAEQCFERCLARLKPSSDFEMALRQVQVKYAQRLASHGVRQLERIDPLAEHTKMLETLKKEQAALASGNTQTQRKSSVSPVVTSATEIPSSQPDVTEPMAPVTVQASESESAALAQIAAQPEVATLEEPQLEAAALEEPQPEAAALEEPQPEAAALEEPQPEAAALEEPQPEAAALEEPQLEAAALEEPQLEAAALEEPQLEAAALEEPQPEAAVEESALSLLSESAPELDLEALNSTPEPVNGTAATAKEIVSAGNDVTQAIADLDLDDFSAALSAPPAQANESASDTSDFASLAGENEQEAGLGEDVFAMLQDKPPDLTVRDNTKSKSSKNISIDHDLLGDIDENPAEESQFDTVYSRSSDMKPYRREHSKFCCSACSKVFFTKEQVEACFFSHPEQGSEEERLLLEKVAKLKNKTAA